MSDKKTAGRPRKAPHDQVSSAGVSVRLTPRAYRALQDRAERMGMPMTWVARSIILTALEDENE